MIKLKSRKEKSGIFHELSFIKNRRGNILTENIIFIILNLVFLSILIIFVISKMGSAAVLEEKYAKQIALAIDAAEPGMVITLNMEDAIRKAEGERDIDKLVSIEENVVTVKLREKGGYSYSFFNDVRADAASERNNIEYFFTIVEK